MTDDTFTLFNPDGKRLYLTKDEREAFMTAATTQPDRSLRTFCGVLHHTGCRLSETLQLTPERVDLTAGTLIFRSLKKRGKVVYRAVPVPPDFLDALDLVHGIREAQGGKNADQPLWDYSRTTAWRRVHQIMAAARLEDGPHHCPKGLRHGYGVNAITSGVPLNMLQKWLGHTKMETTSIYADAVGEEQQKIAALMW